MYLEMCATLETAVCGWAPYLLTLLSPMSMPSLSSSPWIRGAPQEGFSRHILRIRSPTSREMTGRPSWPCRNSHVAAHPERVTQIRVAALIERTARSNPRLHGSQHTVPGYFSTALLLKEVTQHVFPNCIRDGAHPGWPWSQLVDPSERGVRTVWPAAGQPKSGCLVRDSHVAGPDCSV